MERQVHGLGGAFLNIDGVEVFIPDEEFEGDPFDNHLNDEAAAGAPEVDTARDEELARALADGENAVEATPDGVGDVAMSVEPAEITADTCLQRVLAIFPDVNHEHVFKLYYGFDREGDYEVLPGQARLDNIIEQLVSSDSYPKQQKGKNALKRKREDSNDETDFKKWEQADRGAVPNFLKGSMQAMLKAEFGEIPVNYINMKLATERHLYQAYLALAKEKDDSERTGICPFGKGRPSVRLVADAATIATNCGWPDLLAELQAARSRMQIVRADRATEDARTRAEKRNLERAIASGETAECSACFDDLPMNRQMHCNGAEAHFICFDCAQTYIKTEVGESRCNVLCTAGCGARFASNQLNLLEDKKMLEKLSQLEQEKAIRDAGLEDLEECPFCDYKAILPPIEEDFEFRCANPECEKVSCRRCKSISHVPISCEQHAKDNKINSRHKIEEAMTAALIRACNKCKKTFIKDYGCNKMSCASCGNKQCYVCSKDVHDYNHFDQAPPRAGGPPSKSKLCPLYDNVEERHEREVKEAEAAARAQVVQDNPDVTVEDLEIKVSDAVKKSTANRHRGAAAIWPGAGGYAGLGGLAGAPAGLLNMFGGGGAGGIGARHNDLGWMPAGLDDDLGDLEAFDFDDFLGGAPRRPDPDGARQRQILAAGRAAHRRGGMPAAPVGPPAVQGYIPVLGYPPAQQLPAAPQAGAYHYHHFGGAMRGPYRNGVEHFLPGMGDEFGGAAANGNLGVDQQQQQLPVRQQAQAMPGAWPQQDNEQRRQEILRQLQQRRQQDVQAQAQAQVQVARNQAQQVRAQAQTQMLQAQRQAQLQAQQARARALQDQAQAAAAQQNEAQGIRELQQRNFQHVEQLRQQHHERLQQLQQQQQQQAADRHRILAARREQVQQMREQVQQMRNNGAQHVQEFEQVMREHRERGGT